VIDHQVLSHRAHFRGERPLAQELGEELERIVAEVSEPLGDRLLQLHERALLELFRAREGKADLLARGEEPFAVREELVECSTSGGRDRLEAIEVERCLELICRGQRVGFGGACHQDDDRARRCVCKVVQRFFGGEIPLVAGEQGQEIGLDLEPSRPEVDVVTDEQDRDQRPDGRQ
jgi:hypothetical protein